MKKIVGIVVLLSLLLMVAFPVVTLAADPPDPNNMTVTIVAVAPNGDLTVLVNGDALANKADLASVRGTGSAADLWMWSMVHALEDYALNNNTNIKLLIDSQAKTITVDYLQQQELELLGSYLNDLDNDIWSTKSQISRNEELIHYQQYRLDYTDILLQAAIESDGEMAQWAKASSDYWSNRVLSLESQLADLEKKNHTNGLMVYGGYGLAVCCIAIFVVGIKKHRG